MLKVNSRLDSRDYIVVRKSRKLENHVDIYTFDKTYGESVILLSIDDVKYLINKLEEEIKCQK